MKNWYVAKIIYRILISTDKQIPQFDEQLRLILAMDEKEAFAKARRLGNKEEDTFFNEKNEVVYWQFIAVSDLVALKNIEDGIELYSKIEETRDAVDYIKTAKQKSEAILTKNTVQILNSFL